MATTTVRSRRESDSWIGVPGPYPGPRPFRPDETGLFFGRDREISQLRSLVLAHSLVLLYSESGAGKSSLIRAGLVPALRERNVTVLPLGRIRPSGADLPAGAEIENAYVASMVANAAAAHPDIIPRVDGVRDLCGFVEAMAALHEAPVDEPRVLMIDQFEELFTTLPDRWESRGEFFDQLQRAFDADAELRVVLAIREDYLAQTDPYSPLIDNHLRHRFRLERLDRKQALDAVTRPMAGTARRFAPEAAEYLVDQLAQIRFERAGQLEVVPGEYAEPVQLQIVCATLWGRLEGLPERVDEITTSHIDQYAEVDRALSRFFGEVVGRVAAQTRIDPLEIRKWCEDQLITPGGTRALVYRGQTETEGIVNDVLDGLEGEYLIRGEERAGSHWYELSHDKFVEAIRAGNREKVAELRVLDAKSAKARRGIRRGAALLGISAALFVVVCVIAFTANNGNNPPTWADVLVAILLVIAAIALILIVVSALRLSGLVFRLRASRRRARS